MSSKLGITIIIIAFVVVVSGFYTLSKLQPVIEPTQEFQGNFIGVNHTEDSIGNIAKDLNSITDDSAATAELNTLDEQANSF